MKHYLHLNQQTKVWEELSDKERMSVLELIQLEIKLNHSKTKYQQIKNIMKSVVVKQTRLPEKEILRRYHQLQQAQ